MQSVCDRELSESFEKEGNWVCSSFIVEIEAKSHRKLALTIYMNVFSVFDKAN